ncbi:MAG: hypothetical protein K5663_06870 [Clostridiales bacterium]|nr:hypothetical protein [Clostridiales bacterium]
MIKRVLALTVAVLLALGSLCAFASTDKLEDALEQLNFYLTHFNTEDYKSEVDLSEIANAFASLGNSGMGFYVYANVMLLLEKGDYRTAAIVKTMLESNEEFSNSLDDKEFKEKYPSISGVKFLLNYVDGRIAENSEDTEAAKKCYSESGGFFDSYERLLALSGGESEEMYQRAFSHFTSGEYEEAYKLFYELSESNYTDSASFRDTCGKILAGMGIDPETIIKGAWSEWTDKLPEGIDRDKYEIETKQLYRSRVKETKTDKQKDLKGWTLTGTSEQAGGFGEWSNWSTNEVKKSGTREVETQQVYRYRDLEKTTSTKSNMDGWTKYDSKTAYSDWGAWSKWSTTKATKSSTREVQTKTQYSYRTSSTVASYSGWSSYSGWQTSAVTANDLTDVQTRTTYRYFYFKCPKCGNHWHGCNNVYCWTWGGGCGDTKNAIPESSKVFIWGTTPQSQMNWKDWHGTGVTYTTYNGERVFRSPGAPNKSRTEYRYRTRSLVYNTVWSNWTEYSDSSVSAASNRQVNTRTVYRYRDRKPVTTYYFKRWGAWSEWTASKVAANDSRQVQNAVWYRYRDKLKETLYYYERWGSWSGWSENAVNSNANTQVETKTRYRYRAK